MGQEDEGTQQPSPLFRFSALSTPGAVHGFSTSNFISLVLAEDLVTWSLLI